MGRLAVDVGPNGFRVVGPQFKVDLGIEAHQMLHFERSAHPFAIADGYFAVEVDAFPVDPVKNVFAEARTGEASKLKRLQIILVGAGEHRDDNLLKFLEYPQQSTEIVDVRRATGGQQKIPPGAACLHKGDGRPRLSQSRSRDVGVVLRISLLNRFARSRKSAYRASRC